MLDTGTFSFSKSGPGLFTPPEVRGLMEVEFERGRRYGFPIVLLTIHVDRLQEMTLLHGQESRNEILNSLVEQVKQGTRAGDLLGYVEQDCLRLMLPQTPPRAIGPVCDRLLASMRGQRFQGGGTTHFVTLSIGVSHNVHPDATGLESLLRVADDGVEVARAGGGDRWAETELYALHRTEPKAEATEPALRPVPDPRVEDYRVRLEQMVADDGDLERAAMSLAEEIVQRALREAEDRRPAPQPHAAPSPDEDHLREIELLRRRVAKLSESLGVTEEELARLRAEGRVTDEGVASIYRQVQGLSDGEAQGGLKKELMRTIFEANLDLQGRRKGA